MSGIPAGAGSLLGKRPGKYEILALLALGGTAEIYLARIDGTAGFEKYVVVKCLHDHLAEDPDFVKMFLDEARISATLDHSNVVQTLELGEHEGRYYMVMEYLAGLSLAMVVKRASERIPGGMLPVPLVLNIAAQSCAGLHYAHERTSNGKPLNMVHRDISPQNLVISFEGVVKVVDFGIARAEYRETKTKAGTIKGKFAYMSPEQCVANNVDRRTDVFALGVIVHELLTGRRLFKRNSPYETYQAVLECAVEPPSRLNKKIDPALDPIIMKAIAKDKDRRYPSAEAFGDALLGYLHARGVGSGTAELGRYFDQHFMPELEEHGERMRELIEGRKRSLAAGMGWGDDDEPKASDPADGEDGAGDGGPAAGSSSADRARTSDASLDEVVDGLVPEDEPDPADDDEENQPAERTRIEMNPTATLNALDQQVARNTGRFPPRREGTLEGTGDPAPPPRPSKPVVGPDAKHSGRFPDLPNLPTMVAPAPEPETKLALAVPKNAGAQLSENALTAIAGPPANRAASRPTEVASAQTPPPDALANSGFPGPHGAVAASPRSSPPPVDAGATQVLDSGPPRVPPAGAGSGASPYGPGSGPGAPPPAMTDYPVLPGGQRPFSSDLAPSNLGAPQRSAFADAPFELGAAASLMSPVGEGFASTDWERAAAARAKAVPPWMLAALFVAAVGGALVLTLAIVKLFA